VSLFVPVGLVAQTMVPWLTRSADNARSGWNAHETALSQKSVSTKGIVRSTIIPVIGDARGMEAQPLVLPGVTTALGVRDVMVLPSMANVVRGVDAHDGSGIWQVTLGPPINGNVSIGTKTGPDGCAGDVRTIDCHAINDKWGVLSTGVIDPDTQRLYLVAWVSPDNTPQNANHFVYVLNVSDGTSVVPPVLVDGSSGSQKYVGMMRKQRSSLVLTKVSGRSTVFWASGTIQETANGSAGWIFAFDCASNTISAALATTQGRGAGIWMGGQGMSADAQGDLYVVTGNGDFDGQTEWGESFLKIHYTPPPAGSSAGTLAVIDHWTPWTDDARAGAPLPDPKMAGMNAPSEAVKLVYAGMTMPLTDAKRTLTVNKKGEAVTLVFPNMAQGPWSDEDWGSAGPACIFALKVCIAAGKDGIGYPVKTTNMGGTMPADLANPKANCAKLAGAPMWLTMDPGPVDPCPANPTTLNFFPWGDTAHLHMTPVQFFDPALKAWTIFVWGENAQLHKWKVTAPGKLTYLAQSHEYASSNVRYGDPTEPTGGMPGGFCSGSSNGADPNSAILVCTIPYGDANMHVVNGRLLVYDAVHLAADGSLKVLWDSQAWGIQFLFNKFDPPMIDGGQIYVPNYNGGVDVYKLTQ
jgi:hypothetical protein